MQTRLAQLLIIALASLSCGGGGGKAQLSTKYTLSLDFVRVSAAGLDPIEVRISILKDGQAPSGAAAEISLELEQGSASAITEVSVGEYTSTITPVATGEYPVTVRYHDRVVVRTPIVFGTVHDDWGQPVSVPGLVNTEGYEDGATVTADGSYLFLQYGPVYFSALIAFGLPRDDGGCGGDRLEHPTGVPNRCTHAWFDTTIGPHAGPERPGFFDGRISAGVNLHNAASWGLGVEEAPLFSPSTLFYGFARQADGSYAEPFYVAYEDENDGLINPYGMSIRLNGDGSATMLLTMNDPADGATIDLDGGGTLDVESGFDVYTAEVMLGLDTKLGTYLYSGTPGTPPVKANDFITQKLDFGDIGIDGNAGTQGNSHLYEEAGEVASVWTDDEYDDGGDRGNISVYLLDSGVFPTGSWTKLELPSNVSTPDPQNEIQPFFTGTELIYTTSSVTENPTVVSSAYTGAHNLADLGNNDNWGERETILAGVDGIEIGEIIAVGEPTLAMIDGKEHLFFVYVVIRSYDDLMTIADMNMQVGFVRKK